LINEKIEKFLAIGPAQFSWIKRLSVETSHRSGRFTSHRVELQLVQGADLQTPRLELVFIDAVEIRIGDISARDGSSWRSGIFPTGNWKVSATWSRTRSRVRRSGSSASILNAGLSVSASWPLAA
jgi:hypothetical protein